MSAEGDSTRPANTAPDTHWYTKSPDTEPPAHELVISPAQAISEVLATIGRDAPAAEVRRLLAEKGMEVHEDVVEKVRASLGS